MTPSLDAPSPAATVAMVGAGQLARMTHQAAIDLDVRLRVLATGPEDPAVLAGADAWYGSPRRLDDLRDLAAGCDVLTLDHEQVSPDHLAILAAEGVVVRPGADAARAAIDKLHARTTLTAAGIPCPAFASVEDVQDVAAFGDRHGWPVVLKRRSGGYDGRGVVPVHDPAAAAAVLDGAPTGWIVEEHVEIHSEVAVLVARRPSGDHLVYPVVATTQDDGICRELVMPAPIAPALAAAAVDLAVRVVEHVGGTGIVAVELFVAHDGRLLVNELALRPHNSGHATIESCVTSQFHNHLRAVLDWPLGSVDLVAPAAAMVNVLSTGDSAPAGRLTDALAVDRAHVHLYAKTAHAGRKVGHVTATGADPQRALDTARRAGALLVAA